MMITGHDLPFQGGYGWKKCLLTKVRAEFRELVKEKRARLGEGRPLFLGDRSEVFLDRRMSCRVTRR